MSWKLIYYEMCYFKKVCILGSINCLFADGEKFAHPLHHLGKSLDDLPVLAIDSFRHMYLFPDMSTLTYVLFFLCVSVM